MGMGWMWQLTVPGYIVAGADLRPLHGARRAGRADRAVAGDRAAGRAHAGRGAALLVPVRRRAAGQPRHLPGQRPAGRDRPRRRRDPASRGSCSSSASRSAPLRRRRRARRQPRLDRRSAGSRAVVVVLAVSFVAPARHRHRPHARRRRRPGRRRAGHAARSTCRRRVVTERHLEATRTIEPDPTLDLVLWPENVDRRRRLRDQRAAARRSPPRRPGSACRSPSASPRTCPASPAQITNAQVVVTPDGDGDEPLRQGPPRAVRRVRAAARAARGARRAGRPGARRTPSPAPTPAVHRAARRHPTGRRHLVGGVLRRPRPRGRRRPAAS